MPLREEHCLEALKTCYDPELPVNIVDLGLVYRCQVQPSSQGGYEVTVQMTLTAPGCAMAELLKEDVESKLAALPEVRAARVELVFDPPWDPSRMSEAARLALGLL
ncbi:MAG TPA: DUF59 domain-containing protein [Planctomycetaceae bacterium]|nr:DUF59 domain-containing protein [Planctomycetaceae bacterium]HIQ20603.1 DUF59 domain-containing protein [Planctomycetota bacterium]